MLFDVKMKMLYILFSGHCIASVLFPGWFFQGIQELKYVTYFQLICKLVFVILMVVFLEKTNPGIIQKLCNVLKKGYKAFSSLHQITYIEMVAAWGFDISAVKDVAQYQHVKHRLNEIVSSVLYIRFIFCM